MNNDEMAMRILARLEAIEQRLGINGGPGMSPPRRDDRNGSGRFSGDFNDGRFNDGHFSGGRFNDGNFNDGRANDGRAEPLYGVGRADPEGICRFNEKRMVDQVVQLVTVRLEEMLRVLPQLIQIETRPVRREPPAAQPPAAQ